MCFFLNYLDHTKNYLSWNTPHSSGMTLASMFLTGQCTYRDRRLFKSQDSVFFLAGRSQCPGVKVFW
jgi:hypothetical protein